MDTQEASTPSLPPFVAAAVQRSLGEGQEMLVGMTFFSSGAGITSHDRGKGLLIDFSSSFYEGSRRRILTTGSEPRNFPFFSFYRHKTVIAGFFQHSSYGAINRHKQGYSFYDQRSFSFDLVIFIDCCERWHGGFLLD